MRIGIIANNLTHFRGGNKIVLSLGKILHDNGHEVAYSSVGENMNQLIKKFELPHKYKMFTPKKTLFKDKFTNITQLWNLTPATLKMIREFKPDVVVEVGGVVLSCLPAVLKGIPVVHYCIIPSSAYADVSLKKRKLHEKVYLKFLGIFEKLVAKKTKIASMCYFTDRLIKKMWNVSGEEIIYPPTDVNLFKPIKKKNIILSVCRYNPKYGLERLIEEFRKLKRKDYELHFSAQVNEEDKEYLKKIKKFTEKDKNIFFHENLGAKEGLAELYGRAKFFWHSSWAHYGLIIAEAQCSGIPTISFGRGMGPEEIIIPGKTGFVIDRFEEFSEKTNYLMKNPKIWDKMSKEARKNGIKRLGFNQFEEKFLRIIKKTAKIKQARSS